MPIRENTRSNERRRKLASKLQQILKEGKERERLSDEQKRLIKRVILNMQSELKESTPFHSSISLTPLTSYDP